MPLVYNWEILGQAYSILDKTIFYAIIIKFYVRIRTLYNALILIIRDMAP